MYKVESQMRHVCVERKGLALKPGCQLVPYRLMCHRGTAANFDLLTQGWVKSGRKLQSEKE